MNFAHNRDLLPIEVGDDSEGTWTQPFSPDLCLGQWAKSNDLYNLLATRASFVFKINAPYTHWTFLTHPEGKL